MGLYIKCSESTLYVLRIFWIWVFCYLLSLSLSLSLRLRLSHLSILSVSTPLYYSHSNGIRDSLWDSPRLCPALFSSFPQWIWKKELCSFNKRQLRARTRKAFYSSCILRECLFILCYLWLASRNLFDSVSAEFPFCFPIRIWVILGFRLDFSDGFFDPRFESFSLFYQHAHMFSN